MSAAAISAAGGGGSPLMDALRECQTGAWAHSQLFIWMVDHYETLASVIVGRNVRWARMAEAAAAEGLRTRSGGIAAVNTVKSTWFRVRRAVREQRQKAKAAAERAALEQAEKEAQREAMREAARAERARRDAEAAALRKKYDEAQRGAQWAREREQKRAAEMPSAPVEKGAAVRIGQVAPVFKMLEAAPLYGDDARRPPPPPYVGPRPEGMPENLPLEALVSLEASGRKENGDYDFQNMPGLPRRSFFREEYEWARCCLPMIRAIPPLERSTPMKLMFNWLMSFPGIK